MVESAAPVPTTAPCRHSSVMSAIVSAFECTVDGADGTVPGVVRRSQRSVRMPWGVGGCVSKRKI